MTIGDWVRRKEPGTKWHVVESIVDGAAITRCGRTMEPEIADGVGLEVGGVLPSPDPLNDLCWYCRHD